MSIVSLEGVEVEMGEGGWEAPLWDLGFGRGIDGVEKDRMRQKLRLNP